MSQVYEVHQGGLYRCCLASLDEHMTQEKPELQHFCRYCQNPMRRDGQGVWRWAPEASKLPVR